MSDEKWLAHAVRLNPPRAVEAARPFLHLHLPSGRVSAWGQRAYQVNALSLSADRSLVAYSGSGREVGVIRVADRHAIYEKRRRGEHWASALSADGTRLYLGDADGIGVLDCASGKYRHLVRTGKPGALALSPDGARIVSTSWDAPLSVFETAGGQVLWTRAGLGSAPAAFSPCGRWLAVAEPSFDPERTATLWCLDASTGDEVWSAPLGVGRDVSLAWTPEGDALLGAASTWTLSPEAVQTSSASLAFYARDDGHVLGAVPWSGGIDAVAIAPSGERLAICSGAAVVVLDRSGVELARGTGTHESLGCCAFLDEDTVVAAGRDVNEGPALLSLSLR